MSVIQVRPTIKDGGSSKKVKLSRENKAKIFLLQTISWYIFPAVYILFTVTYFVIHIK